jgi:hypothetical protein
VQKRYLSIDATSIDATADSRRALVARIIRSSVFAKCDRLSSFLSAICESTLSGRASELNEHSIGVTVFGRSPRYDSSIDGIVRTQASRLRQKLDLYFAAEGADEPVRIVLPRGSYVPVFEDRLPAALPNTTQASESASTVPASEPLTPRPLQKRFPIYIWSVSVCLAIALVTVLSIRRGIISVSWNRHFPAHPLWSKVFSPGHAALVVPGDSGAVMWQGIMNKSMSLAEYLAADHEMKNTTVTPSLQAEADDFGNRRYTSIVDLEVVQSLSQIASIQKNRIEIRYARDLRPEDLRRETVVLIGATEANPWVELFERNMNFVFSHDRAHRVMSVINRSPQGDEPKQWDSGYADPQRRVYGVVAYLPNLSGNGNVVIVEGTSMAGTDSAWNFVSDDSQLLPFLTRIRRGDGTVPHFEVVLGTNNFSGSAAKSAVLAWRTSN